MARDTGTIGLAPLAETPSGDRTGGELCSKSDEDLATAAAHGCADAFSALIERHYDRISRLAWRWCGTPPAAEDVAQDVCV